MPSAVGLIDDDAALPSDIFFLSFSCRATASISTGNFLDSLACAQVRFLGLNCGFEARRTELFPRIECHHLTHEPERVAACVRTLDLGVQAVNDLRPVDHDAAVIVPAAPGKPLTETGRTVGAVVVHPAGLVKITETVWAPGVFQTTCSVLVP